MSKQLDSMRIYLDSMDHPVLSRQEAASIASRRAKAHRSLIKNFCSLPLVVQWMLELSRKRHGNDIKVNWLDGSLMANQYNTADKHLIKLKALKEFFSTYADWQVDPSCPKKRRAFFKQANKLWFKRDILRRFVEDLLDLEKKSDQVLVNDFGLQASSFRQQLTQIKLHFQVYESAINELVRNNLRLVVSEVGSMAINDEEFSLFVSEGNVALFEAAHKFDPSRGAFSTHAVQWIRQRISAIRDEARLQQRNFLDSDTAKRVVKVIKFLEQKQINVDAYLIREELKARLNGKGTSQYVPSIDFIKTVISMHKVKYLNIDQDQEDQRSMQDTIADPNALDMLGQVFSNMAFARLEAAMSTHLSDLQIKILQYRFWDNLVSQEIATKLGISVAKLRQQESIALALLRRVLVNSPFE